MQDVFQPHLPIKNIGVGKVSGPAKAPISMTNPHSRRTSLAESNSSSHSTNVPSIHNKATLSTSEVTHTKEMLKNNLRMNNVYY